MKFDAIVYNVKSCNPKRRNLLFENVADVTYGGGVSVIFNILATMNTTTPQMISFADSLIDNNHEQWLLSTDTNEAREQLYEQIVKMYTEDVLCLHKSHFQYIGLAFGGYYLLILLLAIIFSYLPDTVTGKPISIFYQPNAT